MRLWFLLIDGGTFHAKGFEHKYVNFYEEWMKLLGKMLCEILDLHRLYKKFIDDNIFSRGDEVVYLDKKEQESMQKKRRTWKKRMWKKRMWKKRRMPQTLAMVSVGQGGCRLIVITGSRPPHPQ